LGHHCGTIGACPCVVYAWWCERWGHNTQPIAEHGVWLQFNLRAVRGTRTRAQGQVLCSALTCTSQLQAALV
jgi:hypothetical protein